MNLSEDHQLEVNRYLSYFRSKKDGCVREVEQFIADYAQDNVTDSIYNREDVEEMMQKLKEQAKKVVDEEVTNIVHVSGIYVQTALTEAEKKDVHVKIDLNLIENNTAIDNIKKFESKGVKDLGTSKSSKSMGAKLPTLSGGNDPAVSQKAHDLEEEVNALRSRNKDLQAELIKSVKDKKDLPTFSIRSEGEYAEEIQDLKAKMGEYEQMIKEMKDEINKKMSESTQFNNLKKMMQQRNEQIKDLRERLGKYEKIE